MQDIEKELYRESYYNLDSSSSIQLPKLSLPPPLLKCPKANSSDNSSDNSPGDQIVKIIPTNKKSSKPK